MKFQLLISTMHQNDYSILENMNINSDAIIINQGKKNDIQDFKYKEHNIKWMSLKERGVGLSRNTAIMRATGDVCLFADDDMVYKSNYEELVVKAFKESPKADIITFNINSKDNLKKRYTNTEVKKLNLFNSLRYGAPRIAVRLDSLQKSNIYFSLLYGGGAPYSSGEDSLFLVEAIKNNLKVYSSPYFLGETDDAESTWFEGYSDKFYKDKGYWLANAFPIVKYILAFYYAWKLKNTSEKKIVDILKLITIGIKCYDNKQKD